MKIAVFSTKPYDKQGLSDATAGTDHEMTFIEARLTAGTAALAQSHDAVCAFVNDELDAACLMVLQDVGVELILLRCAGYNQVDLKKARELGLTVARVPAYSPYAVAEHTMALMLGLNRHLHRAYVRVRDQNFSLDGLQGFDMRGKTIGIVGTGQIGTIVARLLRGFHCEVLASDPFPNDEIVRLRGTYVELDELFGRSHVVTLHCPLVPATDHLVDERRLGLLPRGALVVNTSRGRLVDSRAAIEALKTGHLGGLAIDVYEEESGLFFEDRSEQILTDDVFARLLSFPNVLVTSHQAFFTHEALANISATTIENASAYESGTDVPGLVDVA